MTPVKRPEERERERERASPNQASISGRVTLTGPRLFSANRSESPEEPPDSCSVEAPRLHAASATVAALVEQWKNQTDLTDWDAEDLMLT